jgi:sarcosine oxidase subunit beta
MLLSKALSKALSSQSLTAPAATYDAVIVGAGVIGASVALELSKKGYRTLNIDRESGAGHGSSAWSSGILRTFYTAEESCKFAWEGYHYFADWENHVGTHDELGLAPVREVGAVLLHTPAQTEFLSKVCSSSDVLGVPYEALSKKQIEDKYGW